MNPFELEDDDNDTRQIVSDAILRRAQGEAERRRQNVGLAEAASDIAHGLSGAHGQMDDSGFRSLASASDAPVDDLLARRKAVADNLSLQANQSKLAYDKALKDPSSTQNIARRAIIERTFGKQLGDQDLSTADASTLELAGKYAQHKADMDQKASESAAQRALVASLAHDKNQAKTGGLTKGQEAADKDFAKTYEEYVASGGSAGTQKSLSQLRSALAKLKQTPDATGPLRGLLPDAIRSITNPTAIDIRENIQAAGQDTLRKVLGAQFTEKEGQAVLARMYNDKLTPEKNRQRVASFIKQLESQAQAKEAAARYFEEHGTLKGFQGKIPTTESFAFDDSPERSGASASWEPQTTAGMRYFNVQAPDGSVRKVPESAVGAATRAGGKLIGEAVVMGGM